MQIQKNRHKMLEFLISFRNMLKVPQKTTHRIDKSHVWTNFQYISKYAQTQKVISFVYKYGN